MHSFQSLLLFQSQPPSPCTLVVRALLSLPKSDKRCLCKTLSILHTTRYLVSKIKNVSLKRSCKAVWSYLRN